MLFKIENYQQFEQLAPVLADIVNASRCADTAPWDAYKILSMAMRSLQLDTIQELQEYMDEHAALTLLVYFRVSQLEVAGTCVTVPSIEISTLQKAQRNVETALRSRETVMCFAAETDKALIDNAISIQVKPGELYFVQDRGTKLHEAWWVCCWTAEEMSKPAQERIPHPVVLFGEQFGSATQVAAALNYRVQQLDTQN